MYRPPRCLFRLSRSYRINTATDPVTVGCDCSADRSLVEHSPARFLLTVTHTHAGSSKMPKASSSKTKQAGSSNISWQRQYKRQLVDNEDGWLKTSSKEDEDAVIAFTVKAIQTAHGKTHEDSPLPDQLAEVRRFNRFLVSSLRHYHTIDRKFRLGSLTMLVPWEDTLDRLCQNHKTREQRTSIKKPTPSATL